MQIYTTGLRSVEDFPSLLLFEQLEEHTVSIPTCNIHLSVPTAWYLLQKQISYVSYIFFTKHKQTSTAIMDVSII